MGFLNDPAIASTLASLLVVWLVGTVAKVLMERRQFQKLPGPPCNLFLGHLISIGKVALKLPQRAHPHLLVANLMREYDLPPVFYMDSRPASSVVTMVIADPEVAREVSESGLPKHPALTEVIKPLAGRRNILVTDGALWKKWRSVFNPGFSIQQVVGQVPVIVECVEAFTKILDEHASAKGVFRLEEETTKVTIDVIGRVICDHDFKTLTTDNKFMETMRKTLSWMPDRQSLNPWHRKHPLRPLFWKYYKWKMDKYIGKILDDRFTSNDTSVQKDARRKPGIDLALQEYYREKNRDIDSEMVTLDAEFRQFAIDNLLILLFAGHDTTASTLCYWVLSPGYKFYHLLDKHPHVLEKVRQELDDVFGAGVSATQRLKDEPYLINKCEYMLAVIKEVLRLWSPASAVRLGQKGYFIKDPVTGKMLPTEGLNVWVVSMCIHRDARIWGPDVDIFRPERFLPENADKVPPNAWRPFERGPRNCIGQELALTEIKIVLALTLREFDIRSVYDELEALSNDGSLWAEDASFRKGPQEVFGEPMYQILLASGKPREGMPARVSRREMQ